MSEAIRYLIIEALRTAEAEAPQEITAVAPIVTPTETKPKPKRKPAQSGTTKRPNTNKWKVGNKLPCPICNGWYSSSNFARDHAKKHGYVDGYDFLTAHDQQATEMKVQLEDQ